MPAAALAACVTLAAQAPPAFAHSTSEAYLTITAPAAGHTVEARLDIALADVDEAVGLDDDGNGEITWGELRARQAAVAAYAVPRVGLQADGRACEPRPPGALQVAEHGGRGFAVLALQFDCPDPPRTLALDYRLFADVNPTHRGLLKLQAAGAVQSAVLDPAAGAPLRLELARPGAWRNFVAYVGQGVWHIWIGLDHILFLVALLLPAVLWREGARWVPADTLRGVGWDVLKVVTGFTVAHSITLTLATLGWLVLPARPVESLIAASVALAAVNNVWPLVGGRRWLVAFGFGLVHGFGFAGALAELGLPQGALAVSLLGFNVGVELGQLAIVLVFLPLAFALRRTRLYRRAVLVGGSGLIALLALAWFAERAFGLEVGLAAFGG
ncbi:MAG: HupE/UreJ family protein [Rubrivivax sp.]|nr:HupE/UreJ family protein [Rubrivivax sp.]